MIAESKLIGENEKVKLTITIEVDNKGLVAENVGRLANQTNLAFERMLEYFNCNELKVHEFCKVTKEDKKK